MGKIVSCTRLWPLFVTVMPAQVRLDDVEPYIEEVNRLYDRRRRFATLVETSGLTAIPDASVRKRLTDWQLDTVELIRVYNVFTATVVPNPLVRGALTAMNWIFRPPNEQVAVSSFAEGFERCVARLSTDGGPIPGDLAQLAQRGAPLTVADVLAGGERRSSAPI